VSTGSAPHGRDNPLLGIFCKVAAHLLFALMFAAVKWLGPEFPTGQIVFWRSAIGILVIVAMALATGGPSLLMTRRIDAHAFRSLSGVASMFCNFAAFTLLPLADATTLGFAQPLFVVALAAVILGERVRIYRWSAVLTGLLGVLIIVGPYIEFGGSHLMGAALAIAGAALSAVAMIYLRRMSAHEHSVTIAFYFMATTSVIGLCTALFGWVTPTPQQMLVLLMTGLFGGAGQLFLSFSYRYVEASALAPFDYTALIWATALGYFVFGELPMLQVWLGAAIIVAAGLFILWREHRLGKARALQVEAA
jgi:drug/metabolite transporter (DMT)-like permease